MHIGGQIQNNPYSSQSAVNDRIRSSYDRLREQNVSSDNLQEKLRNLRSKSESNRDPDKPIVFQAHSESVISQAKRYTENLRLDRSNLQKTEQAVKKLKYSYKDVSSKVLRSKTSLSAKQVVGQAKREVTRLKRAIASGNYDTEELTAALAHAKAVERVAKKKAKHLEQEEIATASAKNKEMEERTQSDAPAYKNLASYEETAREQYDKSAVEEALLEADEYEQIEEITDLEEFSVSMMEDLSEAYNEMLEDLGYEELVDSVMAASGDMTPEDIKMMKVEHRSKEIRELLKADMEYLKAVFDHMEKQQQTNIATNMAAPATGPSIGSAPVSIPEAIASVAPTIDLSV